MTSTPDLESKIKLIKPLLIEKFHVKSIGYFGSYASGLQRIDSDLDLLVEFTQPIGWNFFTLERYLEKILGLKVDLVTPNALKSKTKASILSKVKYI